MKKIVFAALAMSLASSLAAQPKQTLSFDEALNLTLTNNPSIKASTYEQEAAERERKAAYGLRLPKIGVTGAYAYLSEDINIDLNGMKEPVGGLIGGMGGVLPPPVLQQAQALMKQNWALPLQDRSLGTVGRQNQRCKQCGKDQNQRNGAERVSNPQLARLRADRTLLRALTGAAGSRSAPPSARRDAAPSCRCESA